MALSLADELAAFDDAQGAGGISLAEEFGLDLDIGEQNDLGMELAAGERVSISPSGPGVDDRSLSAELEQEHLGAGYHHPTYFEEDDMSGLDILEEPTTGPGQYDTGLTDVDALLEGQQTYPSTLLSHSLSSNRSPQASAVLPERIEDDTDINQIGAGEHRGQERSVVRAKSGFLGTKVERDPLVELHETLECSRPLLRALQQIDSGGCRPSSRSSTSLSIPASSSHSRGLGMSSSTPGDATSSWTANAVSSSSSSRSRIDPQYLDIEQRMHAHLEKMHHHDKLREEQCRELVGLSREISGMRWEGEYTGLELNMGRESELGLGVVDELDEDEGGGEEEVGWTGEPSAIFEDNGRYDAGPRASIAIDVTLGSFGDSSTASPIRTTIPFSPRQPPSLPTPSDPTAPHTALHRTARLLVTSTPDLITTLSHLSESIHATLSISTTTSRTLRGIKAGVESWREREALEAEAEKGVEDYERKRLEQGLSSEKKGDTKAVLRRECEEFGAVLDGLEERMKGVRRDMMMKTMAVR